MLPPPTTIATSTPRLWTVATSEAIDGTRSGSVPYSRSPISASPESFSITRRKTGGLGVDASRSVVSVTDGEPCKASDYDVLAGLAGERCAQLLDRLAAVLVLVDVLLAQQHHLVEPLVEFPGDDPLADVLGAVVGLLDRDPLFALAVLRWHMIVADSQRRRGRDVQREVARELDELLGPRDEVGLAVDLYQHADLVPRVDVALDHSLTRLGAGTLGGLRLATGPEDLDRLLDVPLRFAQRLAAGGHACAGASPQGLYVLGTWLLSH